VGLGSAIFFARQDFPLTPRSLQPAPFLTEKRSRANRVVRHVESKFEVDDGLAQSDALIRAAMNHRVAVFRDGLGSRAKPADF
jgi:hypothetical protein